MQVWFLIHFSYLTSVWNIIDIVFNKLGLLPEPAMLQGRRLQKGGDLPMASGTEFMILSQKKNFKTCHFRTKKRNTQPRHGCGHI
jgi:hypothetical protein